MAGRRWTLTPELRDSIETQLKQGVPVAVAAQRVGVPRRTLHSWLAAEKVERREPPDPLAGTIASPQPVPSASRTRCG